MKVKHEDIDEDDLFSDEKEDTDSYDDDIFGQEDLDFDPDYGDGQTAMQKHKDLLSKLTDFDPYLRRQVMEWIGLYWDDDQKKWAKDPNVRPMMNIAGARWCVNFLRTYARENNIITTLDKDVYNNVMTDIEETAILNIGTRAEEFGIQENGDIITIANQLIHASELVLVGAGGSKTYSDLLGSTTHRTENVTLSPRNIYDDPRGQRPQMPMPKPKMTDRLKSYLGGE